MSKAHQLKKYIISAFTIHDLYMICLSDLVEIDRGLAEGLRTTMQEWINNLLPQRCVGEVYVYGGADYITIVRKNR